MADETREPSVWWGTFAIAQEQTGCWRVGPSTVWICHTRHEWRIVHEQADDSLTDAAAVTVPVAPEEAAAALEQTGPQVTASRFSFHQTDDHLSVSPALADRPVVVRPEQPLYVLEGETVTLYVSTPLWLRIEVDDPARLLQEIPSFRPSDTWFGPTTMEGELCYATKTTGRLRLEDLPLRLHRAVTPLLIRNYAQDALLVERVRLPVEYLALYEAPNGFLWTQAVTMEREKSDDTAALHLQDGPPPEAPEAALLREPRQYTKTSLIVRPFSMLFHKIKEA